MCVCVCVCVCVWVCPLYITLKWSNSSSVTEYGASMTTADTSCGGESGGGGGGDGGCGNGISGKEEG